MPAQMVILVIPVPWTLQGRLLHCGAGCPKLRERRAKAHILWRQLFCCPVQMTVWVRGSEVAKLPDGLKNINRGIGGTYRE
ncbi:hypothetical protein C8J57DRAFT_1283240 [Mycena rebaudengoi]|jgi:hypothetical protein|nr:hypothetical protein C8J57DRAFT_1283240 [Mycena rebaudengoi]